LVGGGGEENQMNQMGTRQKPDRDPTNSWKSSVCAWQCRSLAGK